MPDDSGAFTLRAARTSLQRRPRHRASGTFEVGSGNAPWLANRGCAACQRNRLEPGKPLEPGQVATQELAAPEGAVGAVTGAVEDECERRTCLPVLGEACRRVGVVVLDAHKLGVLLERPFRREVLGMEVVGDHLRFDVEHRQVEVDVGAKGVEGKLAFEIPEVG